MKRSVLITAFVFSFVFLSAQPLYRKALFLGNSYTFYNNLPGLVAALAHFSGDSLFFGSNTPGGYTLGWQPIAHATDPVSLAKIHEADWDFVVLQEQSQTPAIVRLRDSCMIPASQALHDTVKLAHPCARVLFYMTWGRRFGGIQCFSSNYCSPDFADFDQMQDSVTRAYKMTADTLSDWIAPAGEAWRLVLHSTGMVLHDGDDSHPNLNGSYLTACVFYGVMFGKPATGNPYTAGLLPDSAMILQHAADSITFGYSAYWNLGNDEPGVSFIPYVTGDTLHTTNTSTGATTWEWDFGDGDTSTLFEPVHEYALPGYYTVRLKGCNSCFCDSTAKTVSVKITGQDHRMDKGKKIRLAGPDPAGFIRTEGYTGDGLLFLYNVDGQSAGQYPVNAGRAHTGSLRERILLWRLEDSDGKLRCSGKIVSTS